MFFIVIVETMIQYLGGLYDEWLKRTAFICNRDILLHYKFFTVPFDQFNEFLLNKRFLFICLFFVADPEPLNINYITLFYIDIVRHLQYYYSYAFL